MERLIKDANEYAKANGKAADLSIDSFSDIVTAIELVQEKQGIAGTTAKEAATTIEGSLNMTKAAWENLVAGFANPDADIGQLMDNLVTAIVGDKEGEGLLNQIIPAVQRALEGIGELIQKAAPILSEQLPVLVSTMLPALLSAATTLISGLVTALPSLIQVLLAQVPMIVTSIADALITALPMLAQVAPQIIATLVQGIAVSLPTLVPAMVEAILAMVDGLLSNVGLLAESAVQLMIGLAEGLINATPVLLAAIPGIVMSLADALINGLRNALGPVGELLFGKVDETGQGAANRAGYWGGQIYGGFFGGGSGAGGGSSVKENAKQGGSTLMSKVFAALDETGQEAVTKATGYNGQIYQAFLGTPSGQGGGGQTSGGGAGRADGGLKSAVVAEVDEAGQVAVDAAGGYSGEIHAAFEGGGGKTSGGGAGRGGGGMSADFYATVEQAAEGAREAAVAGGGWVSEDFVTSVASGVAQKGSVVPDAATALMDSTKTAVDFAVSGMGTSGELIPDNIAGGVTSGASTLYQSVNAAMAQANAEAAASAVQAQMAGQAFDTSTAGGIRGSASTVSGAARGTVTGAISSARGATGGAYGVGTQIGSGVASGIQAMIQRVASAAANLVGKAIEAAKARAAIHSPSRVARDEIGKQLGLGVAEGMVSKDVLTALDKSAAELTGDTVKDLETMVNAWDKVYDNYYEGLEHQNFFLELAGDTDGIIANYRKMQETLHEQKEHYLRMGVDANDSAIRDMEEQWWGYQDKIEKVYSNNYSNLVSSLEHNLWLSEQQGGDPETRIKILTKLMEQAHARADELRAQGYAEDSKEIMELQKEWWGWYHEIADINEDIADGIAKDSKDAFDGVISGLEHSLFLTEKNGGKSTEKIAILEQLMAETHKRADELREQGFDETSKEIMDLQKEWWGYHDELEGINDGIIKKFQEIADAAQEAYDKAFDAIMDKQKTMQDKLAGYGELYKSTVTTSGKTYVSLQDLDRQTKQLERYGEIIEELRSRGVSGNLMEDILGMGIDEGSEFGKRLLNMSEGGLNDYLASYQRKQDIAADIAARYYKPEFDALNGQNVELNVAEQRNLEYNEEQTSLLRRIAETFEGSGGQTVQVVVDGQVIANATFDDIVAVSKMRGLDIVNVKEG